MINHVIQASIHHVCSQAAMKSEQAGYLDHCSGIIS